MKTLIKNITYGLGLTRNTLFFLETK